MSILEEQVDAMIDAVAAASQKGKKKRSAASKVSRSIKCCPKCMSTKLSYHNPGFGSSYTPGTDIGVVYGEDITGSYSWDDIVKPIECDKGHVFYV